MDDQDVIRSQMEETRSALTDKLETLEKEVSDKVLSTTESVETVVNAVQDTVESVKDGVQDTVAAVTDKVLDSVEAVKNLFDVPAHVQEHPLLMFTGSIALGFCAAQFLRGQRKPGAPTESAQRAVRHGENGNSNRHHRAEQHTARPGFLSEFAPEIDQLKGLALGALMGLVRDLVVDAIPETYQEPVKEIIKNVTEKMGGTSVQPTANSPSSPAVREPVGFATNRM